MKKIISMLSIIAVLFGVILGNADFASASDTSDLKARFEARGHYPDGLDIRVGIGTLDTMKGGSFIICYDPSVVRYEMMTEEWWSVGAEELEAGRLLVSFQDVVDPDTGLNAFYSSICFEWIAPGTPDFSIEDVTVYDKDGTIVPVETEEQFREFYPTVPAWKYNEETKTLTVGGIGFLSRELIAEDIWDFCREEAKYIILEEGVTGVDSYYFSDFSALEKVTVPQSTESLYENAFPDASSHIGECKFVVEGEAMTEAERFATAYQYPFHPFTPTLLGDIDQDARLTTEDALEILKMVVNMTDCYGYTADIDEDGKVTTDDVLCVLRKVAGIS